jgi:hypothetical protein
MPPQPLGALAFPQRLEPLGRLLDRDADVEIGLPGIPALDDVIELGDEDPGPGLPQPTSSSSQVRSPDNRGTSIMSPI